VAEFVRCFREMKNRCYSTRISEKEAVELASLGLLKPIRDLAFQLEFTSLAHLVQKLTTHEQHHPELYQEKFKRQVALADTEEADDSWKKWKYQLQNGIVVQIPYHASG
jgi:hypothetical protein